MLFKDSLYIVQQKVEDSHKRKKKEFNEGYVYTSYQVWVESCTQFLKCFQLMYVKRGVDDFAHRTLKQSLIMYYTFDKTEFWPNYLQKNRENRAQCNIYPNKSVSMKIFWVLINGFLESWTITIENLPILWHSSHTKTRFWPHLTVPQCWKPLK